MKTNSINNTPDLHSSSKEYAERFAGDLGAWLLEVQKTALLRLINKNLKNKKIKVLDIGGGHGQISIPIAEHSEQTDVTVYGSSGEAFENFDLIVANSAESVKSRIIKKTGSLVNFELEDKSFDVATCFRIISHIVDPNNLISELCRVSKEAVIIDYAAICSVNFLSYLLFPIKKLIEKDTRYFHLFWAKEINQQFEKNGFKVIAEVNQFFCPMALHRALKNKNASRLIEKICSQLNLTKLFGSPKVIMAVRSR